MPDNKLVPADAYVIVEPPREKEDARPVVVTHVSVGGGSDTLMVDFFYVNWTRLRRTLVEGETGPGVEIREKRVSIQSDPIARVALPTSVAVDLIAQMIETVVEGVPEMQANMEQLVQRVAAVMAKAKASGPERR